MPFSKKKHRDLGSLLSDIAVGSGEVLLGVAGIYAAIEYGPYVYKFFTKPFIPDPALYAFRNFVGVGIPAGIGAISAATGFDGLCRITNVDYIEDSSSEKKESI